jgi:16S rRNA (adenine1518-N6/adenine1519-N6)-dimethyltransferase
VLKKRLAEIESDEINGYLERRVITLTPEEILYVSKELNPIFEG